MIFTALVLFFVCFVILVNTPLAQVPVEEVLRRLDRGRLYIAVSGFLLLASYGFIFLISFGLYSPWSWVLASISYGGAVMFLVLRRHHLSRFAVRELPSG